MKPIHTLLIFSLIVPSALPATDSPAIGIEPLVAEIAAHHPERRFYLEEIAAARTAQRTAGRLSDPELSLDVGHKRLRDTTGAAIGDGTVWSVSVTQTFEWPGRLALRQAIADRDVELAELGVARFDQALAARARTLAYGLYAAHAKAVAVREVADRFASLRATFLARDPAGLTPLLETRVIEAGELALQRRATTAELAVQSALIELNQLRGAEIDAPLQVAAPAVDFADAPPLAELIAAARANNFGYRMRQVQLAQQGYAVDLARNERHPGASVGPYLAQDNVGDRETVVGLSLSLPLPISGRTGAAVDAARARRRQAEAAALVARRELDREVATAALAYGTKVAEARRWTADAVARFRDAAALADRHYRAGAVSVATYVELQQSYLDAVEALLDTQGEALAAGQRLRELTGLDLPVASIQP